MSTLKTKALPKKVSASGTLRVMQRLNEYEFGVELWVMREGENRNKWDYRNLRDYYKTFIGQPILIAYVGQQVGDGHNMSKRRDPKTGEEYQSFMEGTAERIVGTLSDDEKDFTLVERGGHTWLRAKGRLFAFYAPELTRKIVEQGTMDVSAETMVSESHKEGDVDVFTKWSGIGVTVLGDRVNPAIPGASIAKLAAMQEEFKELKLRAASLHTAAEGSDGNEPDKNTKKGVKSNMNKRAMEQMQTKFPNHKVLSMSEDGLNVALLDASGNLFGYTFNADDNGEVIASRIMPCAAHIVLNVGEVELNADVADVVDYTVASVKETDGCEEPERQAGSSQRADQRHAGGGEQAPAERLQGFRQGYAGRLQRQPGGKGGRGRHQGREREHRGRTVCQQLRQGRRVAGREAGARGGAGRVRRGRDGERQAQRTEAHDHLCLAAHRRQQRRGKRGRGRSAEQVGHRRRQVKRKGE